MRRRQLLAAVGGLATAGCAGQSGVGGIAGSNCGDVEVESVVTEPRGNEAEETVTLFEDYVVVTVRATADEVPNLVGRVEGCDTETVRRAVPGTGTHAYEFGPYGHHCVQSTAFWFDGCGGPQD